MTLRRSVRMILTAGAPRAGGFAAAHAGPGAITPPLP